MRILIVAALASACNATPQQLQTTEADGLKLAACILSDVLGGVVDPGAIAGQCSGALPAVIVDVIDDFEAQKTGSDAGVASMVSNEQQKSYLEQAKKNAVAALAR